MSYINNLTSPDGLRGMFNIFLTATILTIFEIIFFYKIVVPGVENSMENGIKKVGKIIAKMINNRESTSSESDILLNQLINIFKENNNPIPKTFASREYLITNKINNYTKITGIIIIIILVSLLVGIYYNLKNKTNGDTQLVTPILTSILTIIVLISFQIMFYFFSLKFNYPGSEGDNELLYFMLESIHVKNNSEWLKTDNIYQVKI
jgi:hypothetical protein